MANERSSITASPLADGSDDTLWAVVNDMAKTTPGGRAGALKLLAKRGMREPEPAPVVVADTSTLEQMLTRLLPPLIEAAVRKVGVVAPPSTPPEQPPVLRTRGGAKPL